MNRIQIVGAGPAGSAAAISALQHDCAVDLAERSHFPRHKVCGEFLSPEIAAPLARLGVWDDFVAAKPARIERLSLWFGSREKRSRLPEPGYGLSRYAFDQLLMQRAVGLGACLAPEPVPDAAPLIWTPGRDGVSVASTKGNRLFGFKAHFTGPASDAVELYFFRGCYVGLNAVENGVTNVCGLGPEHILRAHGFNIDGLLQTSEPVKDRLAPLTRAMKWLHCGPLVFRNRLHEPAIECVYAAGDALSFVDPFTGSGILSALLTGELAGASASESLPASQYLTRCADILSMPFEVSSIFRAIARAGWAGWMAGLVPGEWLFRWTRPRSA